MGTSGTAFDLQGALEGVRDGLRDAFAPHADRFDRFTAKVASHDIREEILTELATEPMHGYQLIQALATRTGWTPAAGTVYPTLQQLVDEGLATTSTEGERTVYTLTEAGRDAASALDADDTDSTRGWGFGRDDRAPLTKAGVKLARAAAQFSTSATPEQTERAAAILDDARRKLYAILAEE